MGSIRVVILGAQEVAWELRSSFGADATISTHGTGGEGARFWMSVLTDIKNRGVSDTFFLV
jgi:hypothetical protein